MKNITEKEYYKGKIAGMLDNIENPDVLSYIYVIISDILEEQTGKCDIEFPAQD